MSFSSSRIFFAAYPGNSSCAILGRFFSPVGYVTEMRPPIQSGKWIWAVLFCAAWILLGDNVSFGQTTNSKPAPKAGAKSGSTNIAKPTPGKGKPVSTKGETGAKVGEGESKPTTTKDQDKSKDTSRWREGHRIENVTVSFQISETERFLVTLSSEKGLTALENMALERIADAMRIDSADNRWVVTGRITEFRGQNYLWIERATRATKVAGQ
jgi:hypothetical protein